MFPSKVKCVIWDLDETLWRGTLAEREQIVPRTAIVELIPQLDQKGIINSICSKNDMAEARAILEQLGIWPYIVFPSIDFAPKGENVKAIVENLQLRPVNVLFVDDNPSNRNEVAYYNPEIGVADVNDESFLEEIKAVIAKTKGSSRLEQYRVLEQKHQAQRTFSSNADFLRDSGITICILRNPADLIFKNRIVELVNRSNQLNFTKSRFPTLRHFEEYTERVDIVHGCVFAYDRYGDYGLVGFFAFQEGARKPKLENFVFSCRIMNMGVEHAVWADLHQRFNLQSFASLERNKMDSSFVTVLHELDDRLRNYVQSKMDVPQQFRSSIIAGCTAGVIDHYLPASFKPARYDLVDLADDDNAIPDVDTIIYAVYGDYTNDAWKKEPFSYHNFRSRLKAFLDANGRSTTVLLLASEKAFPHGGRSTLYWRIRGWLSDIYRGKTRKRAIKCNAIVRDVCCNYSRVVVVDSGEYIRSSEEQIDPRHFARIVIQRICEALPGLACVSDSESSALSVVSSGEKT